MSQPSEADLEKAGQIYIRASHGDCPGCGNWRNCGLCQKFVLAIASFAAAERRAEQERLRPFIAFFKWAIRDGFWSGCDLDGGDVQDKAVELGLLTETTYDPNIHGEDPWFVFSPLVDAIRSEEE